MSDFKKTGDVHVEAGNPTDAFEMYESGASTEEINAKFFSADNEHISDDVNADVGSEQSDDVNSSDGASELRQGFDAYNNNTDAATTDEKIFSQKDFDSMVGRRLAKERQAHDLVKSDYDSIVKEVSKLLGVSTDDALRALQEENIRREAESNDVADVELFAQLKNAEKKIADMEEENRKRSN